MTADSSRRGRRNRTAGHQAERDLASWLTNLLDIEVRTSRDVCRSAGGDLATHIDGAWRPHVLGWSVEVKYEQTERPAVWLEQASRQARDDVDDVHAVLWPVVLWKRPRRPVGDGRAFLWLDDLADVYADGWVSMPIETFWTQVA